MARIRNIKPSFFMSDDMGILSPNTRLLYIALWCQCDKSGYIKYARTSLVSQCMPFESHLFDQSLNELIDNKHVVIYEKNDVTYLFLPKFSDHQLTHHTERKSEIEELLSNLTPSENNGYLTVKQPLDNRYLTVRQRLSNGKEREGGGERERKDKHSSLRSECFTPAASQSEPTGEQVSEEKVIKNIMEEDIVLEIPCVGKRGKLYPVTKKDVEILSACYPGVDMRKELSALQAWNYTNPAKRKTYQGVMRHINHWLSKAQNNLTTQQGVSKNASLSGSGQLTFSERTREARKELEKYLTDERENGEFAMVENPGRARQE